MESWRSRLCDLRFRRSIALTPYPDGLPTPRRYWAMTVIGLALGMSVLDSAIANVALPTITHALHTTPAEAIWIVNAYQLAIVVTLLPLASLGEIVGYRRIYQGGLCLFTLASLGCAMSHTLPELILARVVQGLGAAGIMSVNGALVRFTYPHRLLGRGVGLNALIVAVASAIGPTVTSAILAVGTWEGLFAVNVPIGIVAALIANRALPETPRVDKAFDWVSTAFNAAAMFLIVIGVDEFSRGRSSLLAAAELGVGIAAGVVLIRRELKFARPLVPIDLMRIPIFALSVATSIASFSAQMLAYLSLPFLLEGFLHRSAVQTGLLMTPWPIGVGIAAPIAGRLADRWPAAIIGGAGMTLMAVGLALLAMTPATASNLDLAWKMAVCGAGFGLFQAPNNRTLLTAAPRERAGAAGGMLAISRLIGQTTGALGVAFLFRVATIHASHIALVCAAVVAAVGVVFSLTRLGAPPATALAHAPAEAPEF